MCRGRESSSERAREIDRERDLTGLIDEEKEHTYNTASSVKIAIDRLSSYYLLVRGWWLLCRSILVVLIDRGKVS